MNALTTKFWAAAETPLHYMTAATGSSLEGADKSSKLAKTVIAIFTDLSQQLSFYMPTSLGLLPAEFQSLNNVNVLLGPYFRVREYLNGEWGSDKSNYWSKVTLTIGQFLESYLVLVKLSVISAVNLGNKFPIFQTAGQKLSALPYGNILSKFLGLDVIKNTFILASAGFGLKKVWSTLPALNEKVDKVKASVEEYKGFIIAADKQNDQAYVDEVCTRFEGKIEKKYSSTTKAGVRKLALRGTDLLHNGVFTDRAESDIRVVLANREGHVANEITRLTKKLKIAENELAKAKRAEWNEYGKIAVVTTATIGIVLDLFLTPLFTRTFLAIQLVTGVSAVKKIVNDADWADEKDRISKEPQLSWANSTPVQISV